jgi:hypothetical protein
VGEGAAACANAKPHNTNPPNPSLISIPFIDYSKRVIPLRNLDADAPKKVAVIVHIGQN